MRRRYETQFARDLWWALESPMLMEHPCTVEASWRHRETARYQGLFKKLDKSRRAPVKVVRPGAFNGPGEYFEVLIRTWLDEVPPADPIAANWQVYSGDRTIGEFDLIFRRDGQIWHWELAVKFYLGHPAPDGQFRWYGPDPQDRLDRKWAKMRGQQLRLCRHPASAGALDVLGIDTELSSRAFIKGYLFVPLEDSYEVDFPPDINPSGLRGWWVHRGQLAAHGDMLDPERDKMWVRLPELRWMSPASVMDGDRLYPLDALISELPRGTPSLVAAVEPTSAGYRELSRGFVVPDGWPHH